MVNCRVSCCLALVLLTCFALSEGMSLRSLKSLGVELHCRCIQTVSEHIGRNMEKVELILPTSHCEKMEIIATLKTKDQQQVCLDPNAPWVQRVIETILSKKNNREETKKKVLQKEKSELLTEQ